MAHASCLSCHVRFTRAMTAHLSDCPTCGEPLQCSSAEASLGLPLYESDAHPLLQAMAAMLPVPPAAKP